MTRSLHDKFASEEARTAPEPETAEERSERLSRKRGFRIAGLGALIFLLWEAVRMLGNADHSITGVILAIGAVGLFVLFEMSSESDKDEDDA